MSVYIANDTDAKVGGGPNFTRQLAERLLNRSHNIDEADVVFIPGPTMVKRETIAPYSHKKIVLRVDNYLKHSRNRGAGMTRMVDFAKMAHTIVYQSRWSFEYLDPYLRDRGLNGHAVIIQNGSDTTVFSPNGESYPKKRKRYLFVASSTDQSKGWVMAHQRFQQLHRLENCELWLVGKFDRAVREYGFDFFNNERVEFRGIVQDPHEMAKIYRSCDALLYSFFMDCSSNVLNEALLCGMEIEDCYGMLRTGGAPEVLASGGRTMDECVSEYAKLFTNLSNGK